MMHQLLQHQTIISVHRTTERAAHSKAGEKRERRSELGTCECSLTHTSDDGPDLHRLSDLYRLSSSLVAINFSGKAKETNVQQEKSKRNVLVLLVAKRQRCNDVMIDDSMSTYNDTQLLQSALDSPRMKKLIKAAYNAYGGANASAPNMQHFLILLLVHSCWLLADEGALVLVL